MTTTETLDALYAELEETWGDDWELYLILADWYEENGLEEVAEALRWQYRERKRPLGTTKPHWYNGNKYDPTDEDPNSNLPESVFVCLVPVGIERPDHWKEYKTRRQAQAAFYAAYTGAKAKGWKP